MPPYTLKRMAEAGYIMGLATIGEVAHHMHSHYDAYFLIDKTFGQQMQEFDDMVASHENSSIDLWLTDEDKRQIDEEMEKAMAEGPSEDGKRSEELREVSHEKAKDEEGEQENKHF